MKKLLPYLLIGGAAVGLTWLLKQARDLGNIVPDLVGVSVNFSGVKLKIRVYNTSSIPIKVQAVRGNLILNGKLIGFAQTVGAVDVPPGGESFIYVNFIPSYDLLKQIVNIAAGLINADYSDFDPKYMADNLGRMQALFLFDGYIDIAGVSFPVKLSYRLI